MDSFSWQELFASAWHFVQGQIADTHGRISFGLLLGGLLVASLALLVEACMVFRLVAVRRSVFGLNAVVQVALAMALLVGANFYSFQHYYRFDWTNDQRFTLPEHISNQLAQLQDRTTVVVYLLHKASEFNDKPTPFDYAAEEKIVEKRRTWSTSSASLGHSLTWCCLMSRNSVTMAIRRTRIRNTNTENKAIETSSKNYLRSCTAVDNAVENSIFFYSPKPARMPLACSDSASMIITVSTRTLPTTNTILCSCLRISNRLPSACSTLSRRNHASAFSSFTSC